MFKIYTFFKIGTKFTSCSGNRFEIFEHFWNEWQMNSLILIIHQTGIKTHMRIACFIVQPFYKRVLKRDKVNSTACASKKIKTFHRKALCQPFNSLSALSSCKVSGCIPQISRKSLIYHLTSTHCTELPLFVELDELS